MTATGRGPAYRFWERVQRELDEQRMTQTELVERSGVTAAAIGRFRTAPHRDRVTRKSNVIAVAKVLGIPDDEAIDLAGLAVTTDPSVSVRESIARSGEYTDAQKQALLGLLDVLDAANRAVDRDRNTA